MKATISMESFFAGPVSFQKMARHKHETRKTKTKSEKKTHMAAFAAAATASAPPPYADADCSCRTNAETKQMPNATDWTKFTAYVKQKEIAPRIADDLKRVLSTCEIVLLCDDSSSMASAISEDGRDPFIKTSTRWSELKKLAAVLIELVTCVNPKKRS